MKKHVMVSALIVFLVLGCTKKEDTASRSTTKADPFTEGLIYAKAALDYYKRSEKACWGIHNPSSGDKYVLLVKFPDVGPEDKLTGWQMVSGGWTIYSLDNNTALFAAKDGEEVFTSVTPDVSNLPCVTRGEIPSPVMP